MTPFGAQNAKKSIFPVLGAVVGETPADQFALYAKCGPSEPCLRSRVSLGLGAISSVLSVRDPTDKNISDPKKVSKCLLFVAVSNNVFLSKTERFFFFFGP